MTLDINFMYICLFYFHLSFVYYAPFVKLLSMMFNRYIIANIPINVNTLVTCFTIRFIIRYILYIMSNYEVLVFTFLLTILSCRYTLTISIYQHIINNDYYYLDKEVTMTNLKYSRQREAIKEYLASTTCHPTADTVYMNIKKLYPNISLGTVYRNLSLLAEHGEIIKISCGDGSDRFDANIGQHYHLICSQCGEIIDLQMDSIEHINAIANASFPGKINGHTVYFYGTCENCLKAENYP